MNPYINNILSQPPALRDALEKHSIHIEVPRVDYKKLSGDGVEESADTIRARVQAARNIQRNHFSNNSLSDIVRKAGMRFGGYNNFANRIGVSIYLS